MAETTPDPKPETDPDETPATPVVALDGAASGEHDEPVDSAGRRMQIIRKGTAGRTTPVRREASEAEVRAWMVLAASAAASKASSPTVVLDVGEVLGITTWFVLTSAGNSRLVKTIVDTVEEQIDGVGGPKPLRVEGLDSLDWVVMDYGDFVVHVFLDDVRSFYELERLYRDVPVVDWAAEVDDGTDAPSP